MSSYGWSEADYKTAMRKNHPNFQPTKGRNKFNAVRTTIGDETFDSRREAARYGELLILEAAGEINALECQVPFPIRVTNLSTGEIHTVSTYIADFRYWTVKTNPAERDRCVIEDVKSEPTKTAVYRLKKKLVEALYGIQVTEVR